MTSELLNKIYMEYKQELIKNGIKESKAIDMFNLIKKFQREVIITTTTVNLDDTQNETITKINKGRSDWLKQNPIMAKVCKNNGITKSKELRDMIYIYWGINNG